MKPEKLLIYGTGSLGEKIYEYNKRDKMYDLVAFVDDDKSKSELFCGLPVITFEKCKEIYKPDEYKFFVAIGYVRCNSYREQAFNKVKESGYSLSNYISPNSICFDNTVIGNNILICDNVFIGHGCQIFDGVILSVGCTLSHENVIEQFSFISSCVVFGGHAKVKKNCFIGLHSTVRDSVVIEEYNIVGSATNVLKSTTPSSVTIGNPGKSRVKDTKSISI